MNNTPHCILLVLLWLPFFVVAQLPDDTIRMDAFNSKIAGQLFLKELNQLRSEKKLSVLSEDGILVKAAEDQADYCNRQSSLSHYQRENERKYDVGRRIKYYGGAHKYAGENCLMMVLLKPVRDTESKKNIVVYTYRQLAHQLFVTWKASPAHYENMVGAVFTLTGVGFKLSADKQVVYVTQVFASEPYIPPRNGLAYSDTTWGVKEFADGKCKSYGSNEFLTQIFSSYLIRLGDSVFQYYMYEKTIKEIIANQHDGIAIDLVYKNQFICLQPDRLHPSSVFDGFMLQPVYRDELFKNDQYPNREFLSFVGKVPPRAPSQGLQLNTILIQNGMACRYSFPVQVEEGTLPDVKVVPQWCKTSGELHAGTADFVKEFEIPFEKNEKTTDGYYFDKLRRLLNVFDGAISSIEITAFSSVEGTAANNLELQNARAAFIENFIARNLRQAVQVRKQAEENWSLFYKQLTDTSLHLPSGETNREELRSRVNERMTEPLLDSLLRMQRVARIRLHVHKAYNNNSPVSDMPLALYDGLFSADTLQARIAYTRMIEAYSRGELGKNYLTAIEVPLEKKNLPLISNYLASIIVESDVFGYEHFTSDYYRYIRDANKLFRDFKPLDFNFCVFKTHLYLRGLVGDIPDFKKLETDILKYKKDAAIEKEVLDHLCYNYYLTGSILYRDERLYEDMYACFEKVKPFLSLASLDRKEVFEVAKYFNYFFRFNETINLLEIYLKQFPEDEDMVYMYVTTGAIYNLTINYNTAFYYQQVDKLAGMNRARLCKWMNENFQLLRLEDWEAHLCKYCTLTN